MREVHDGTEILRGSSLPSQGSSSCIKGQVPGFWLNVSEESHTWQEVGQWIDRWYPQVLAFNMKSVLPTGVIASVQLIIVLGATAQLSPMLPLGRSGVGSGCPKLNVDVQMALSRGRDMDN